MKKESEDLAKQEASKGKFAELAKRTKTVLIILPVIGVILYYGGNIFNFAAALLLVQMLREFYAMQREQLFSRLAVFSVLISTLCCLSLIYINEVEYSLLAVGWLACVIAATDIGAYFAGRLFGRNKIWPAVSPGKTWEGALGGFALAALVSSWFGQPAILGVIIGVLAQMGDFTESAIKRKFGVKDSGNLLPGHGGILDRFDGYLYAAPFAALLHFSGIVTW